MDNRRADRLIDALERIADVLEGKSDEDKKMDEYRESVRVLTQQADKRRAADAWDPRDGTLAR